MPELFILAVFILMFGIPVAVAEYLAERPARPARRAPARRVRRRGHGPAPRVSPACSPYRPERTTTHV